MAYFFLSFDVSFSSVRGKSFSWRFICCSSSSSLFFSFRYSSRVRCVAPTSDKLRCTPNKPSAEVSSLGSKPCAYRTLSSSTTLPIVLSHPSTLLFSHWYSESSQCDNKPAIFSICSRHNVRLASNRSCSRCVLFFSSASSISNSAVSCSILLFTTACCAAFSFSFISSNLICSAILCISLTKGCHCFSSFCAASALCCSACNVCKRSSDSYRHAAKASVLWFLFFVRSSSSRLRSTCILSCSW